jgi:hypothetical protein
MANPEYKIQFKQLGRLLWVCGFALLYAWGGMEMKWLRRFIAPLWLGGGMYLFTRNWKSLLQIPLLIGSLHLGYGASAIWEKIIKRAVYGFAAGISSVTHIFSYLDNLKQFMVPFLLNVGLCITVSVVLGVFNPFNARAEELIIGFFIGFLSMFMARDKDEFVR